jgi:hypothetical protein
MTPQHAALCRITAAVEESRPDREAMAAFVRKAIDELPAISTTIGWHMRKDAADALGRLLTGWNVHNPECRND